MGSGLEMSCHFVGVCQESRAVRADIPLVFANIAYSNVGVYGMSVSPVQGDTFVI